MAGNLLTEVYVKGFKDLGLIICYLPGNKAFILFKRNLLNIKNELFSLITRVSFYEMKVAFITLGDI